MVEWSSNWFCVPASTFCVRTHPLTTRGGVRFEMGWAGHIRGSCPGRRFGWFRGVGIVFAIFWRRSGSRSCSHLLAVNGEVVGTHDIWWCVQAVFIPQREVVPGDGRRWWGWWGKGECVTCDGWRVMLCGPLSLCGVCRIWVSSTTLCRRSALSPFRECANIGISSAKHLGGIHKNLNTTQCDYPQSKGGKFEFLFSWSDWQLLTTIRWFDRWVKLQAQLISGI